MFDTPPNASTSPALDNTFSIVSIGCSAGGIEATSDLISHLPDDIDFAVVVVQHLGANSPSMLSQILARQTRLNVQEATHQQAVQPGQIYVIPPDKRMTIEAGCLQLSPRLESDRPFMSIDIFMKSLAASRRNRAIGVVLSGLDGDGARGLEAIKQAGGITFAQTQDSAQYGEMPNTAVEMGFVDFILSPDNIARKIVDITQHPYVSQAELAAESTQPTELLLAEPILSTTGPAPGRSPDLSEVYALLKATTGTDFSQYKRTTFERRMQRRMALYRISAIAEYAELLKQQPSELKALYRDVLISVTSFFRDPESFEFLKETIFSSLVEQKGLESSIRLWVSGCSTGQECYSLAIALFEYLSSRNVNISVQIFGTDVNEDVIDIARKGIYTETQMDGVSPERRHRFFIRIDGHYQVSKAVRELCVFARQNLGSDAPFSNIDFISCRNVLIYFDPALQKRVLAIFHYSLNVSGFLWLGSSESIGETSDLFSVVDRNHKAYSRSSIVNRLNFDFVTSDQTAIYPILSGGDTAIQLPSYSNVQRQADQIVLNRYAPVGVVINDRLDILHFRGDTSAYLSPAPGEPSFNLLKMLQPSLLLEVRSAIDQAKKQQTSVRRENLATDETPTDSRSKGQPRYVHLEVTPIKNPLSQDRSYLVLFEEGAAISSEPASDSSSADTTADSPEVARLKRELAATRQELLDTQTYLQATIEEHDATNQRLTTANEEILSSNEELQSTNEELQTAKEEIQAANEELKTTNEELQGRNADARSINDDLLNLLNNVNVPVVMLSSDLRIRRFTPNAQSLFNLIPSDVGRPLSNIRLDIDIPNLESVISAVIDTLEPQQREVKDSEGHWYRLRVRPYRTADNQIDGAVMALVDIDDIKRTLQQLEASRLYAESIVETMREPLVVLTSQLAVKTANRAFYEVFQGSPEETEGRLLFEVKDGQWNIPLLRAALDSFSNGGEPIQDIEVEHNFSQLGRKTILLNGREIEQILDEEQPAEPARMLLLSIEDISKRKRAEQERFQLAQERSARVEAEAANASKDEFLSVLSHELRTPLNAILGWTEILLSQTDPDPTLRARALTSIDRSARTQTRIIEDLLEVSRIVQGQLSLQRRSINLTELIGNVVEGILPAAERAFVQLVANLEEPPDYYYLDPERLQQVFNNALSNAIKFTPQQGRVEVTLAYQGDRAQIKIADTGNGIASEFLPYVFDRFRQADSSNSRQYGGLGLGLAIIKVFVEAHEGTVQVSSPGVNQGTTLIVTLPLTAAVPPAAPTAPPFQSENLLGNLRILVVEDDADNLDILTVTLEAQSATVITATSVDEAIQKMTRDGMPDLLISDISLPGRDGFSLIEWVRSRPPTLGGDMPAIALTGYAALSDTDSLLAAGFQYHLVKPTSMDELLSTVISLV